MKIKNEKILIKCGKKRIELRNLILDAYLNQFANAQISIGNAVSTDFQKCLNYCLLKFEEPLYVYDDKGCYTKEIDEIYGRG